LSRPVFIINFKNYAEILGESALRLARSAERVSATVEVDIMVAPPIPCLASIASSVKIPVIGQKVEDAVEGKSTGAVIPEALKAWGCAGSLINHSESRTPLDVIANLVPRMRWSGLTSCVCAESSEELVKIAPLAPEYIAVEPPELIGTGISVSKARPELISDSVAAAKTAGYHGRILCGAGIVSGDDAKAAADLGARGILVASSVVKSTDWEAKIRELASALL
jgi:triosephosphate isomerase